MNIAFPPSGTDVFVVDFGSKFAKLFYISSNGGVHNKIGDEIFNGAIPSYIAIPDNYEILMGFSAMNSSAIHVACSAYNLLNLLLVEKQVLLTLQGNEKKNELLLPLVKQAFKSQYSDNHSMFFVDEALKVNNGRLSITDGDTKTHFYSLSELITKLFGDYKQTFLTHRAGYSKAISTLTCHIPLLEKFNFIADELEAAVINAGFNKVTFVPSHFCAALASNKVGYARPLQPRNLLIASIGAFHISFHAMRNYGGAIECVASKIMPANVGFDTSILSLWVKHITTEASKKMNCTPDEFRPRTLARLNTGIQRILKVLQTITSAAIEIDSLHEGNDFYYKVTAANLKQVVEPGLKSCIEDPITELLKQVGWQQGSDFKVVYDGAPCLFPIVYHTIIEACFGKCDLESAKAIRLQHVAELECDVDYSAAVGCAKFIAGHCNIPPNAAVQFIINKTMFEKHPNPLQYGRVLSNVTIITQQ